MWHSKLKILGQPSALLNKCWRKLLNYKCIAFFLKIIHNQGQNIVGQGINLGL